MNRSAKEKVASELIKLAEGIVAGRMDEGEVDELYNKTQKIVDKLSRKFRKIRGIKVLSDWSGDDEDSDSIHLGNAGEGGEVDGFPAADYGVDDETVYEMGVHKKLVKELDKYGYHAEWYDSGTLMAYE